MEKERMIPGRPGTVCREEAQAVSGKTRIMETARSRPEGGQPVRAPASDTTLDREAAA